MTERFRVVLARAFGDEDLPGIVVGAIPESTWEHDPDGYEQRVREIQEDFAPGDVRHDYDWREAWVTLDGDALKQLFAEVELDGTVAA